MKTTIKNPRKRILLWTAIFLWIAIWTLGGIQIVKAVSLIQAADNSGVGLSQSWNRAFVCSAETELCYAFGGGTTGGTTVDDTYFYTPGTDSWATSGFAEMPAAYQFQASAWGTYEQYIWATESSSGNENTLRYNVLTDSWATIADPVGFNAGSGYVGINIGATYYLMRASSNIFTAYSIDITNPGVGWSSNQDTYSDVTLLQRATAAYDPVNQVIVIITRDNGLTWIYDPVTGELTDGLVSTFPPCTGAGTGCYASLFFYDASLGLVAGKQGDPGATTIGLYQFDPVTGTWSASQVETLTDSDFNYAPFTDFAPKMSYYTPDTTGITFLMFGGGWGISTPAVAASEWFIRTGDPGGVTTEDRNFDTWYQNFLNSMGMGGTLGKLLVSSIIGGVFYFVLAIKGAPWIISLGITGLIITTFTAALVFDPAILLGLVAIVMAGGMFLIFAMIFGGGDSGV